MIKKHLLVLNTGSSSLKFAIFEVDKSLGKEILSGGISLLAGKSVLTYKKTKINIATAYNLKTWWNYLEEILANYDIRYVGFRMVHGGEEFTNTVKINKQFFNKIKKYNKLAPLHNPVSLELMSLVKDTWPRIKMSASFDTAWYQDLKPEVYLYSLPSKFYKQDKIRKYGFHGLSHEMATKYAAKSLHKKINKFKAVTCHLGSGSSLTWYIDGKVKDTTMGFSPNEGLTMSTRSGDIPASIVFFLADELKMPLIKIKQLLNNKSGLLGLANMADLRDILLAAGYRVPGYKNKRKFSKIDRQQAKLALGVYVYDIRRYLASYVGMSKKLDAIVFTGAVGINSPIIRRMVMRNIVKPKGCRILIAPEGEINNLAEKTYKCLLKK
ncbi:acetate kinase [Candidatus Parcubacteria bacterium]|jgi:acetate kinase|nr:acetate kinase [Candidatus Parcubacteria bacterium]